MVGRGTFYVYALDRALSFLSSPSEFGVLLYSFAQDFGLTDSSSHGEYSSVAQSASASIPFGEANYLQVLVFCRGAQGSCWQPGSVFPSFLRREICHALSLQDNSGLPPPHLTRGQDIQTATQRRKLCSAPVACVRAVVQESSFSVKWPQSVFLLSLKSPSQKILIK